MKKLKLFALLLLMATCTFFASCDGNDKEDVDPAELNSVIVNYSFIQSDDVVDFYDVIVSYGIDEEEANCDTVGFDGWTMEINYGVGEPTVPNKVYCKAVMTPKVQLPTIDLEKKYSFKVDYNMDVIGCRNDGQTTILKMVSNTNPNIANMPGNKVQEYLDKGEQIIVDFSHEIK